MMHSVSTANPDQFRDLQDREADPYAKAKYELLVQRVRRLGFPEKHRQALNIGCGSGELSFVLSAEGFSVMGVDPVSEYIDLARERARQTGQGDRCQFAVGTADSPQLKTYNVVVAADVLEHIEDDRRALAAMCARVADGGVLLLTLPAMNSVFGYHDEVLGHFRRYDRAMLRKIVPADWEITWSRYFGFALIPIALWFSRWRRQPYPVRAVGESSRWNPVRAALSMTIASEKIVPLPRGTSLLFELRRRPS